jgi:hypothetical protein
MAYEIKTGDTWPPLTVTLTESCLATDTKRYHPLKEDGSLDTTIWVRRMDLSTAPPDSLRMILKLATPLTIVEGAAENVEVVDGAGTAGLVEGIEPGLGVPANRGQVRYPWQAGDTSVPSEPGDPYKGEVEITWDSGATPPSVETFPNDDANNFSVKMGPDLD